MSLVGNLEDLGLGEILQIVSLSRKSGVLAIQSCDRQARIFFRQGQVVKASSTAFPIDLGELLLSKGVVDQTTLEFARSLQQDGEYKRRLGEILVKECNVDHELLENLGHSIIEQVAYSLFSWHEGTFDFELQENLDAVDDLRTDTIQIMLQNGLNAQYLAMEGSRIIDEQRYSDDRQPDRQSEASSDESVDLEFNLLQEPSPAIEQVETLSNSETEPDLHPEIMVIDDEAAVREQVARVIKDHGLTVCSYGNGEEALIAIDSIYRSGGRPIIVLDLIMPRMDGTGLLGGLELLELVRANFPEISAIVLSDRQNSDAERRLAELGCKMMIKPDRINIGDPSFCSIFAERLSRELDMVGGRRNQASGCTVNIGDELRMEMGEEASHQSPALQSTGISLLRGMLEELNNPALGGGIILLVLRFASEFMARAVIFTVKGEEISGLGQFGIDDWEQSADARVRAMRIPCKEKTVFSQVVDSQLPVKLQMDNSHWSRYLLDQFGCNPVEAFIGPIVSEGRVVALLYGDNGDEGSPIGDTDSLEIFLSQAGIAMEKAILQQRLKERNQEVM